MIRPESEAALAEGLRDRVAPLRIAGGGTRGPDWLGEAEVLSTAALTGIRLYEPGALTLVAGAGTPLHEVEATLAAQGQRLAFEPPDLRALLGRTGVSTLGGVAAANASGPRRVQAGACRDALIGLRFVTGRGEVVANGGRVMKNVTGHDLVKLLAGSHGILGVLTEVAFKLAPRPETQATLTLHGLSPDAGVAAMARALAAPFEVTGAAHLPGEGGATRLRIEGFAPSVAYRLGRLKAQLGPTGAEMTVTEDATEQETLWSGIRDALPLAGIAGDVWRLALRPSTAPAVVARLPEGARWLIDRGGGLVWVRLPGGEDLRARLGEIQGHATCLSGGPAALPPETPEVAALTGGLRAAFDPRGILNPGLAT
jgi:glycolate oxidase FAD binding subunit